MSKQEGDCKYFVSKCKSIAYGVLSCWGNYNCYYDGGPFSKHDFVLRGSHSWGTAYCKWDAQDKQELYEKLREAGAVNIIGRFTWNYIELAFDLKVKKRKEYDAQEQADIAKAKQEHLDKLNAIDVSGYVPTKKVIDKLTDYRARGTSVNLKAIKDLSKIYIYYYAAVIMKWTELCNSIYHMDTFFGHKVKPDKNVLEKIRMDNGLE